MKKMYKRALSLCMTLLLALGCFACGNSGEAELPATSTPTPTKEVIQSTPTPTPLYTDLGGMEIVIADWWTTEQTEPDTAQEIATKEYRDYIQQTYNFTIVQKSIGSWGDHKATFIQSTAANMPAAQLFVLDNEWLAAPLKKGLCYDLSTLKAFDFTEDKWNKTDLDLMTVGDSVYGMVSGVSEPRIGVFYNKRLFEDANLDPELPYNLQASGEWTWDKFYELCDTLTRDTNNDTITDTYALASFSKDYLLACAVSNNANFISKKDGEYYNSSMDASVLEAMEWGISIIDAGFVMPKPEDASWNWFVDAFKNGSVAMTVAEEYKVTEWASMTDDWGFVMFPQGPKAENCLTSFRDNIIVMPSCFDEETANKIAFAYNLYTNPTPGYEDTDDWKTNYYGKFRDMRAVDETLAMMLSDGFSVPNYMPLIDGISFGDDFAYAVYARSVTATERLEELSGTWQAILDDFNK